MNSFNCLLPLAVVLALPWPARADADAKQWGQTVDKALAYLKSTQAEDGSWSKGKSPGVTGVALTGILETGRQTAQDDMPAKALNYIESLINPKAGHIAGADPKVQLQNYVTSINVMALRAAKSDKYKSVIADAAAFLKKLPSVSDQDYKTWTASLSGAN